MKALLALPLLSIGCAQVLGLDQTKFDQKDAHTDAPSVCDGAPACTHSTGRSVCGQLFGTGDTAGVALRVADPTGAACTGIEGPCAFAVAGIPMANYFDGSGTGQVDGVIDDCGRFVVGDLDASAADVAVVFSGANGFQSNATLVVGRDTALGEDRDIRAFTVSVATTVAWASQMSTAMPPIETGTGYLVEYTAAAAPLAGEAVTKDNMSAFANPPGTVPWAGYFTGTTGFGALDPAATTTQETGTALAVLGGGMFSLEGFRTGRRCKVANLQQMANTLIHLVEIDC